MTIVINASLACSKTSAMFGPSGNLWACEARGRCESCQRGEKERDKQ